MLDACGMEKGLRDIYLVIFMNYAWGRSPAVTPSGVEG